MNNRDHYTEFLIYKLPTMGKLVSHDHERPKIRRTKKMENMKEGNLPKWILSPALVWLPQWKNVLLFKTTSECCTIIFFRKSSCAKPICVYWAHMHNTTDLSDNALSLHVCIMHWAYMHSIIDLRNHQMLTCVLPCKFLALSKLFQFFTYLSVLCSCVTLKNKAKHSKFH